MVEQAFFSAKVSKIGSEGLSKPMPPFGRLFAENQAFIIGHVSWRPAGSEPLVRDVLLHFHTGGAVLPTQGNGDFTVVNIGYSAVRLGSFVRLG
jgi:hypothetical protein